MFGNSKRELELQNTIDRLQAKLTIADEERQRLEVFYEETKEAEIKRLTTLVDQLSTKNEELSDAKEAARKELQKEYSDKVKNIEEDYASKLQLETASNAKKFEIMESQATTEINNRVDEAVAQIRMDNKELKMERKHEQEMHNIYKKKFESGKVELGADEIKGMLLSANPNGQKIIETMSSM